MLNQNYNIGIDADIFEAKLRMQIGCDLHNLEIINDLLSKTTFPSKQYFVKQDFSIFEFNLPNSHHLQQREITKCFKSIVASLQDYIDSHVALLRIKTLRISYPRVRTRSSLNKIVQVEFEKHLMAIATDQKLNVPKKLEIILDMPEQSEFKKALKSYFDIRNGMEHHKGIAAINRKVIYRKFGILDNTGTRIYVLDTNSPKEGITMKTFEETIAINKGGELHLTKVQLIDIAFNLINFIIPEIQKRTKEKFTL